MQVNKPREIESDTTLHWLAVAILWLGIIGAGALIAMAGDQPESLGSDLQILIWAAACFIAGYFWYAVLKGFADIIYLLNYSATGRTGQSNDSPATTSD